VIDIRRLRYFLVVAEELHYGRAAERLRMAQSPLSQQIRLLERELGVELLVRGHHVVGLTDAGRAVQRSAAELVRDLDRAVEVARRAARGEAGSLCVGYVNDLSAGVLPVCLSQFRRRFPDVAVDLCEGTTGSLLGFLGRGEVDVAFARSPAPDDGLEYEELAAERLLLALPSGHGHATTQPSLADLARERFVLPRADAMPALRRDIDRACRRAGLSPIRGRETTPLTAIVLLVAAGAGLALVPESAADHPVPGVCYRHLEPAPTTTVGVAWRPGETSKIVHNFLATTREVVGH
jgi:DNA-binding transcriptional LysR family regulator